MFKSIERDEQSFYLYDSNSFLNQLSVILESLTGLYLLMENPAACFKVLIQELNCYNERIKEPIHSSLTTLSEPQFHDCIIRRNGITINDCKTQSDTPRPCILSCM